MFSISTGEILGGAIRERAARLVQEWAATHHDELIADWERIEAPEQPLPIPPAAMTPLAVITAVEPLKDHWLRLTFADGEVHEVDMRPMLSRGGVFSPILSDRATFEAVRVDEFGTIVWPGEVDLDPDVLRGTHPPASGTPIPRRMVRPASLTSA